MSEEHIGAERRRSPRSVTTVPIVAAWVRGQTVTLREQGETEVVNAHGALIKLPSSLRVGQVVKILRPGTQLGSLARVVGNRGVGGDGRVHLAIEFDQPKESFWTESPAAPPTEPLRFDLP